MEYAKIFFKSVWYAAIIPPYNAVNEHHIIKKLDNQFSDVKISCLPSKKIPAETKVAEWINADAGTGASIESGNQTWNPNCADLQNEQITTPKTNICDMFNVVLKTVIFRPCKTYKLEKFNEKLYGKNKIKMTNDSIRDTSLNLLKKNALNALLAVPILVVQKLISKNEKQPINSHPNISVGKFPEANNKIMLIKKKYNRYKKFKILGSPLI